MVAVRPRCSILNGVATFELQSHSKTVAKCVESVLTPEFRAVTASRPNQVTTKLFMQMRPERNPSYLIGIGYPGGTGGRHSPALTRGRQALGDRVTLSPNFGSVCCFKRRARPTLLSRLLGSSKQKEVTSEEESSTCDLGHEGGKWTPLNSCSRPRVSYYL